MITASVSTGFLVSVPAPRSALPCWLCAALLWLVALQRRHRERMQLAAMDDAALKDVGLSRCDVAAELRKRRWRR